jgi:transposase
VQRLRRTHLRHHDNIAKRLLIHIAGFNLGLLMRKCFGVGKPRCLQGRKATLGALWAALIALLDTLIAAGKTLGAGVAPSSTLPTPRSPISRPWLTV